MIISIVASSNIGHLIHHKVSYIMIIHIPNFIVIWLLVFFACTIQFSQNIHCLKHLKAVEDGLGDDEDNGGSIQLYSDNI